MRLHLGRRSPFRERASRKLAETMAAERRKREEKAMTFESELLESEKLLLGPSAAERRKCEETPTMPDERIDCPHCGRRRGAGAKREPSKDYPGQVIIWQGELVREVAFRDGACAAVCFEAQTRESVGGPWTVTWRDYVEDWKAERVIAALRSLRP